MAKRKVRHALVRYTDKDGNHELAFRNQIVDFPADQVKRLDDLGATIAVDEDLPRPGRMIALPETATEAEILSWVMGATNDEVAGLVKQRPAMAARITAAHEAVKQRFVEQDKHLGGLKKIAEDAEAEAAKRERVDNPDPAAAKVTASTGDGTDEDLIGEAGAPVFTGEDADKIVAQGAREAAAYIAENPRSASIVLEAENRLAVKEDRDPRVSVVRAAQAAAGFTA